MPELVRPYRGVSAVDRQADRRVRLLEACLSVVGRDGLTATTVAAVCAEAGLTKRYFYESFADLDAILIALLDGLHTGLSEQIHAALAGASDDPTERARITITLLVDRMGDPRMARFYADAGGHPRLERLREDAYSTYADIVLCDVLGLTDPLPADQLRALVYVTGTTQSLISWLRGGIALSREALIDALVSVIGLR